MEDNEEEPEPAVAEGNEDNSHAFQLFKGMRGDSFGRLFKRELFKLSLEHFLEGFILLIISFYISENYDRAYFYDNTDHGGQLLSLQYGTAWLCLISSFLGMTVSWFWGRFVSELHLLLSFIKIYYCFCLLNWGVGMWCCLVLFNTFGKRPVGSSGYAPEMHDAFICTAIILFLILILTPIHVMNISYYSSEAANGESISEPEDSQPAVGAKSVSQFLAEAYISLIMGVMRVQEMSASGWVMARTVLTGDFSATSVIMSQTRARPDPPAIPSPTVKAIRIMSLDTSIHDKGKKLYADDDDSDVEMKLNDNYESQEDSDNDDNKSNHEYETDDDDNDDNASPYEKWKAKSMQYWNESRSPIKIDNTKRAVSDLMTNAHGMFREAKGKMLMNLRSPAKKKKWPVMVEDDIDDDGREEEDEKETSDEEDVETGKMENSNKMSMTKVMVEPIIQQEQQETEKEKYQPIAADVDIIPTESNFTEEEVVENNDEVMSPKSFHTLWPTIADSSGQFTCKLISRVDSDALLLHLQNRGFHTVYVATGSDMLQEIGICNIKLTPDQPWFLAKFVIEGLNFSANVRCQNKGQSNVFVRAFQLAKILTIES